jgi:desumoylating isopeptidase 1
MEVQLYVYDLSGGIARSMSAAFLGVQIDAIYHTSIVMEGIEYVYDSGIKTVHAGSTHLGQPMQVLQLGTTGLPMEIVMEYLDSMREIFTPEVCIQVLRIGILLVLVQ